MSAADEQAVFSSSERNRLDAFANQVDIAAFWLTDDDRSEVIGWRRTDPARLAAGIQIGALRHLGFIPTDLTAAPIDVVKLVAEQLDLEPGLLDDYRPPTRTLRDHIRAVERHLGFQRCDRGDLKALGDWLVLRAMEHDRPITLFGLACDHLRSSDWSARPSAPLSGSSQPPANGPSMRHGSNSNRHCRPSSSRRWMRCLSSTRRSVRLAWCGYVSNRAQPSRQWCGSS